MHVATRLHNHGPARHTSLSAATQYWLVILPTLRARPSAWTQQLFRQPLVPVPPPRRASPAGASAPAKHGPQKTCRRKVPHDGRRAAQPAQRSRTSARRWRQPPPARAPPAPAPAGQAQIAPSGHGSKRQAMSARLQRVQDFFAELDWLRCASDAIRPSTPLALISCANCVR